MGGSECSFLLDENVGREVAHQLTKRGHHVDLVIDIVAPGISGYSDILPCVQEHDLVVVTKDCSDFSVLPPGEHEGLILVANHAHSPIALAEMIDKLPDAYPSRQAFGSKEEHADDWVSH